MAHLGKEFRHWRAEKGMLLIHASILMGVTPSQLSGWETGRDPWPDQMRERVEALLSYKVVTKGATGMSFAERVNADLDNELSALDAEFGLPREHLIRMAADMLRSIRENAQKGWADQINTHNSEGRGDGG
jgi:transcriptional regulator with XRE-family HTH domain